MKFIRANIDEITRDPALKLYGSALAFLHVLAFLNWKTIHPLSTILDLSQGPRVCWPFFENCGEWQWMTPQIVESILRAYLVFAIATVALFFRAKKVNTAWWALLLLNIVESFILFQDYRLRLNQHYMTFWVTFAFLFLPYKRRVLMYLIASFYFWAGTLKFTPDWISGAGLYGKKPLGVPESLVPASCIYVILLELVVVFGLLVRNRWIFWFAFTQFVLFHLASWTVVGFFYPTLMLTILLIFPLSRYFAADTGQKDGISETPSIKKLFLFQEKASVYIAIGMFAVLQSLPYAFPGNQTFTGEGRLFALHMFDAPLECRAWVTIHFEDGTKQEHALRTRELSQRIKCDPNVYFSLGKSLCRRIASHPDATSMDLHLETRRASEKEFISVIEQVDFCGSDLHYDLWRPNAWILK